MEKLYRISCVVMAVVTVAALILTLVIGFSKSNPNDSLIGKIVVISLLAVMGVFTVFGVIFLKAGGRLAYKIGFYIMHCGILLLIVGLLITALATKKYPVTVPRANFGQTESSIRDENGRILASFAHLLSVEDGKIEYYDDGVSPKNYEATLGIYDPGSRCLTDTKTLRMNHPARVDGYKIYLVGVDAETGTVALLFKQNPGEYVTIFGFAFSLVGAFLSCFAGVRRLKAPPDGSGAQTASGKAPDERGGASQTAQTPPEKKNGPRPSRKKGRR